MPSTNITMLQTVADGLKELKDELVFVGGSVAELYANDPAASDIRPTLDVDCVNELSSRIAHAQLEANLRKKGFANDTSEGAPICRWIYKEIKVDVMPDDVKILGFSLLVKVHLFLYTFRYAHGIFSIILFNCHFEIMS